MVRIRTICGDSINYNAIEYIPGLSEMRPIYGYIPRMIFKKSGGLTRYGASLVDYLKNEYGDYIEIVRDIDINNIDDDTIKLIESYETGLFPDSKLIIRKDDESTYRMLLAINIDYKNFDQLMRCNLDNRRLIISRYNPRYLYNINHIAYMYISGRHVSTQIIGGDFKHGIL